MEIVFGWSDRTITGPRTVTQMAVEADSAVGVIWRKTVAKYTTYLFE